MQAMRFTVLSVVAALALCTAATTDVLASPAVISSGPANYCKPALPAFDGQVRTRPLAVQNEGNSTAFVTCSMGSVREFGSGADTEEYEVTVSNNSAQQMEIICTAVAGRAGAPGTIDTSTKGVSLAPGFGALLQWSNADFDGVAIPLVVSYSCALPPGGAINDMYVLYDDGF